MTQNRHIEEELTRFLESQTRAGRSVTSTTDLLESNILDSLLLMDLVLHVEATYQVRLLASEMSPQHFRTLDCLAQLVRSKLSAHGEEREDSENVASRREISSSE